MIHLKVPSISKEVPNAAEMLIHEKVAEDPDLIPDVGHGINLEEISRVPYPMDLKLSYEKLTMMTNRMHRLFEWMRWQLLVDGQMVANIGGGDSQIVYTMANHTSLPMKNDSHINDLRSKLPILDEHTSYRVIGNTKTFRALCPDSISIFSAAWRYLSELTDFFPSNVNPWVYDAGYRSYGLGVDPFNPNQKEIVNYVPDGVLVFVPMLPPLFCFHPFCELAAALVEANGQVLLKVWQNIGFWQPPDTAQVVAYKWDYNNIAVS